MDVTVGIVWYSVLLKEWWRMIDILLHCSCDFSIREMSIFGGYGAGNGGVEDCPDDSQR